MDLLKKNWAKHLLQWGVLIIIILFITNAFGNKTADPEAYCPFGGLQTLATYFTAGSMACSMTTTQIMMGVVLAVGAILLGKLFCGYLCPLGLINEMFFRLRRSLKIKKIKIANGSIPDKFLRIVKYLLLFVIFYTTISSSELFCKNFDPYYALATGFKGEITVWMTIISVSVLFLGSLFVDMFWCKYICPLGAISNIFRYIFMVIGVSLLFVILSLLGLDISWVVILIIVTLLGYFLEILMPRTKFAPILHISRDEIKCNKCNVCEKKCPYHIDLTKDIVNKSVDCTLCGACVSACKTGALTFNGKKGIMRYVPALVTIVLFFVAIELGNRTELPTIDVKWNENVVATDSLKSFRVEGLTSVKCYGSSMALKAQLQKVRGVYGVKTFVKHHHVDVFYDPAQTTEDIVRRAMYTPVSFRINSPAADVKEVKCITLRTEKMYDKMDVNYFGMQLRQRDSLYYGLESEYDCPLIIRLYMDPSKEVSERELKEIVETKILAIPLANGGVNEIKCDYEFVRVEPGDTLIPIRPYLEKIFKGFKAEYNKKIEMYEGKREAIYEIANQNYEKPIYLRNMPFLSNHLSKIDGVMGVYLVLNEDNMPSIQIKYSPDVISEEEIWKSITMPEWTITYKDTTKIENAKIVFKEEGVVKSL